MKEEKRWDERGGKMGWRRRKDGMKEEKRWDERGGKMGWRRRKDGMGG